MRSSNQGQFLRFQRRIALATGLAIGLTLLPGLSVMQWSNPSGIFWINSPAVAQRVRVEDVWRQVYQEIPDLPMENTYVNQETGNVSPDNTLVNRLIRYHIYIKGRSTGYRFDWKLTLADYLGSNERIDAETYPSGTSLRTHPMQGDITAVRGLTRPQREALVKVLVESFNPQANQTPPSASPSPSLPVSSSPAPSPAANPRFPKQPQPGDADLLLP